MRLQWCCKNELFAGTIRENLCWGNESASDEEIRKVCRMACADEFITAMPDGYDTYIEQGDPMFQGAETKVVHCKSAFEKTENTDFGRFYKCGRYKNGCHDPKRIGRIYSGNHKDYYCAAHFFRPKRRQDYSFG